MVNDDLEKVNKKIKEQFDNFGANFNKLFGIKKTAKVTEEEQPAASEETSTEDLSKQFQDNWKNFASGIMSGFQNIKKTTEEQNQSFITQSEENKEKFNNFFGKMKKNWEEQVNKWKTDAESKQTKTKQDWDLSMQKVKSNYDNWREEQKREFKEGLKDFSKMSIKGAYQFLIFMIPIIVVLAIIMAVIYSIIPG